MIDDVCMINFNCMILSLFITNVRM
jgi:hypothetical protein